MLWASGHDLTNAINVSTHVMIIMNVIIFMTYSDAYNDCNNLS